MRSSQLVVVRSGRSVRPMPWSSPTGIHKSIWTSAVFPGVTDRIREGCGQPRCEVRDRTFDCYPAWPRFSSYGYLRGLARFGKRDASPTPGHTLAYRSILQLVDQRTHITILWKVPGEFRRGQKRDRFGIGRKS